MWNVKCLFHENVLLQVRDVWKLSVRDRWRLYRRWLRDVCEGYRRTITQFQKQFEAGAKRLKDVKNMEDFEILKNADVVGMTTTGKFY